MSWNHRVMRTREPDGTYYHAIHEVYYREDGSIKAWTADPVHPGGASLKELHRDLVLFERAFTRHILDVRGEQLFDVGLTGRTKAASRCVYDPSDAGRQAS